ncbi:MAG: superoxide dismutase [Parcubacteria group bacterium]|nr:superoxide dismutase [Parcubacteria group bacterium]
MHKPIEFNLGEMNGISKKTNEIHEKKLYVGYVNKRNEVEEKLSKITPEELTAGNQTYSYLRGLKEGETFAANGMILHQMFFSVLGGNGDPAGTKIVSAIEREWGSAEGTPSGFENFKNMFTASALAARGWAILCWDFSDMKLHIYTADAQNQGGVWNCAILLNVDVYEHAYFIDHGSDRQAYLEAFFKNINWHKVDEFYNQVAVMNK